MKLTKRQLSEVMRTIGKKGASAGGKARAAKLSAERLSEIGRLGAAARKAKQPAEG